MLCGRANGTYICQGVRPRDGVVWCHPEAARVATVASRLCHPARCPLMLILLALLGVLVAHVPDDAAIGVGNVVEHISAEAVVIASLEKAKPLDVVM